MEIKERNLIIGVLLSILGYFLAIVFFPVFGLLSITFFFHEESYLFLGFFVIGIALILYGYFLIRPPKTFNGRKKVAKTAFVFGLILIIIPTIGIILVFTRHGFHSVWLILPFLAILLPGVALFIHSLFLKQKYNAYREITSK